VVGVGEGDSENPAGQGHVDNPRMRHRPFSEAGYHQEVKVTLRKKRKTRMAPTVVTSAAGFEGGFAFSGYRIFIRRLQGLPRFHSY